MDNRFAIQVTFTTFLWKKIKTHILLIKQQLKFPLKIEKCLSAKYDRLFMKKS